MLLHLAVASVAWPSSLVGTPLRDVGSDALGRRAAHAIAEGVEVVVVREPPRLEALAQGLAIELAEALGADCLLIDVDERNQAWLDELASGFSAMEPVDLTCPTDDVWQPATCSAIAPPARNALLRRLDERTRRRFEPLVVRAAGSGIGVRAAFDEVPRKPSDWPAYEVERPTARTVELHRSGACERSVVLVDFSPPDEVFEDRVTALRAAGLRTFALGITDEREVYDLPAGADPTVFDVTLTPGWRDRLDVKVHGVGGVPAR